MSTVSTHILDTALGIPAAGVAVSLARKRNAGWLPVAQRCTDANGRIAGLTPEALPPGLYCLTAEIGDYFAASEREALYVSARIDFKLPESGGHYHLPFLISPWSWSTYRGS